MIKTEAKQLLDSFELYIHDEYGETLVSKMKEDFLEWKFGKSCSVCKSTKKVEFVKIVDCNLCSKCNKELSDSFELTMCMDRSDYPEL